MWHRYSDYGSWAFALEPDEENEVCICQWHATPEYYTDTYRPDGEGGLYLARRDTEVYYSADGVKSFTEVYAVNEQPLAYADLDRDGEYEILVLTTSEPDEFAKCRYTLEARKYNYGCKRENFIVISCTFLTDETASRTVFDMQDNMVYSFL